ncbi:hypothetical protein ABKN59_000186 [Abortiporus biennis]
MVAPLTAQSTNVQQAATVGTKTASKPGRNNQSTIRSKKEVVPQQALTSGQTVSSTKQEERLQPQSHSHMKNITRKSSKPIINWFQRKLAGTVRARRASDPDAARAQRFGTRSPILKDKHRRSSVPVPPSPIPGRQRSGRGPRGSQRPSSTIASTKRNTISLNEDADFDSANDEHTTDSLDVRRTSSALESIWSPNSVYEADEDASVRPLAPGSAPPSPSPSHSSASYLSDPRTFASMAASTKPTTLLSVDLAGGMAHIAQAPPTPTTPHRIPHGRTNSTAPSLGGSITFSALPPASPSRPASTTHAHMSSVSSRGHSNNALQAPQHTTHHPRNNPRPSSPPMDDASLLTLASSAFGIPGGRTGLGALAFSGRGSVADDSMSHFSGPHGLSDSTSHFLLNDVDGDDGDDRLLESERDNYGDVDASVRALRPRSSRRGSWESEASGWSARVPGGTPGTPSALRERSLWTNGSYRTGARSVELDTELEERENSDSEGSDIGTEDKESCPTEASATSQECSASVTTSDNKGKEKSLPSTSPAASHRPPPLDKVMETPKASALPLNEEQPALPPSPNTHEDQYLSPRITVEDDQHSIATSGNLTDAFVSAPSTPLTSS